MNKGDNYLITYHTMNKTVLAMFLEEDIPQEFLYLDYVI